jgi:hypothetical protein
MACVGSWKSRAGAMTSGAAAHAGPSPAGGTDPAPPGVDRARTRYPRCRGDSLPPDRHRRAVSRGRPGSLLACGRRVVDGHPEAGGVGAPGVIEGDRSTATQRPWASGGHRPLSAPPEPARDAAWYAPHGSRWGARGGRALRPDLHNCMERAGGLQDAQPRPNRRVCICQEVVATFYVFITCSSL